MDRCLRMLYFLLNLIILLTRMLLLLYAYRHPPALLWQTLQLIHVVFGSSSCKKQIKTNIDEEIDLLVNFSRFDLFHKEEDRKPTPGCWRWNARIGHRKNNPFLTWSLSESTRLSEKANSSTHSKGSRTDASYWFRCTLDRNFLLLGHGWVPNPL